MGSSNFRTKSKLGLQSGAKPETSHVEAHQQIKIKDISELQIANNKGADQTVRKRRLVYTFVCKQQSQGVHMMLKPRLPGLRSARRLAVYKMF